MCRMVVHEVEFKQMNTQKVIRVLLPDSYDKDSETTYPVLYMQDGQNLIDGISTFCEQSWRIDVTLDRCAGTPYGEFIVVGIDNAGEYRFDEYSPWKCKALDPSVKNIGGKGSEYADFLVDTVVPFIGKTYRVQNDREHTAIAGSSMGGVISLYTGVRYSEVFGAIGAFSTASWTAQEEMFTFLEQSDISMQQKFFLSVGTNEGHIEQMGNLADCYVNDFHKIKEILTNKGVPNDHMLAILDEGASHREQYWSKLFPQFVKFWINA